MKKGLLIITLLLSGIVLAENITLEQHSSNSSLTPLLTFSYNQLFSILELHYGNSTGFRIGILQYSPLTNFLEQHAANSSFLQLSTFQYLPLLKSLEQHFTNSTEMPLWIFSQKPYYGPLAALMERHNENSTEFSFRTLAYSELSEFFENHITNSTSIPLRILHYSSLSSTLEKQFINSTELPIKIISHRPLSTEIESHIANSSVAYMNTGNKADFSSYYYTFDVKRDFSSVQVQIKNNADHEIKNLTAIVLNPEEPMSFIGYGEPILPISLQPGEVRNLTIGLTLSRAKKLSYTYKILLYYNSFIMDESLLTLNLPSWDKYNFSVTGPYIHSPWNISFEDVKNLTNSTVVCLSSKQDITIRNTGNETISDLSVSTSGDLQFFLQPGIEGHKIMPNATVVFTAYVLVNNETPKSNGTITISGANTNVTIFVTYTPPPAGGDWSIPPEFPTESYLTATVLSFLCINQPHFCVNINLPSDLNLTDTTTIRESYLIMNFEDRCSSAQSHDTSVYLNNHLVKTWIDTVTQGQYEFPVPREYVNISNSLCVNTYNYKGGGHFCASVGNTLRLKLASYKLYCMNLACNKTEENETIFDDGKDNDCDGFTDCNDLDSCGSTQCNNPLICPLKENCTNGIDDDGNGLTDWEDITQCIGNCSDGYKNGQEIGVDCGGSNCSACVPDLTLHESDISFPNPLIQGQNVNISITVDNIGYERADNFKVKTHSNTSLDSIDERIIPKINARENVTFNFNYSWSELGFHEILVNIDPDDEILELNETNNNASRLINILPPYCYTETTISGVVKRNNVVMRNVNVSVFFNGNSLGKNVTNTNGVYSINLNLSVMPSAGSVNITVIAKIDSEEYTYYTKISCGEDRDFDIVMEDWNEPPVIYTLDEIGQYERVFTPNSYVDIVVVVKNPLTSPVAGKITVYVEDESGKRIGDFIKYKESLFIGANSYKTYNLTWNTEDYGKMNLSGFEFIGKKFYVTVKLKDTYKYGFYVDEYGVPNWLRNNTEFHPGSKLDDILKKAADTKNESYLKDEFKKMMDEAKDAGFKSVLLLPYNSYGYVESHQPGGFGNISIIERLGIGVNYWFPTGSTGNEHYSTPHKDILRLTQGNEEQARQIVKDLVNEAKPLKVIGYIDPMAIYSPDDYGSSLEPDAKAHKNSTNIGWASMEKITLDFSYFNASNITVYDTKKANFLETYPLKNVTGCLPLWYQKLLWGLESFSLSNLNHLAVEMSPCGPGKLGLANDENAFSPSTIESDLNSPLDNDPSYHYHIVKQVRWLIENYGFDGIMPDDEGRLIMAFGPASYDSGNDYWTCAMKPAKPTQSLYGVSEDPYCESLRGNMNKDDFAMDALANMINHMRDQVKEGNNDRILVSNDYFVPSDVGWKSIFSSEDAAASDQFTINKESFARWAYKTYYDGGYKNLRNDLRRSTTPILSVSREDWAAVIELQRKHLFRAVLLAISWANKVHSEILNNELEKSPETKQLLDSYIKMRSTISLPIYSSEVGQELLYHSNLKDPSDFQIEGKELERIGNDKPYTVLYRIPSYYGEKARILHVINTPKVISGIWNNNEIPTDYSFIIKIPAGEEVSGVYLVSADLSENGSLKYSNYVLNVTGDDRYYHKEDSYLFITTPKVITSTVAYIEFKPANMAKTSVSTFTRTEKNGSMQTFGQYLDLPILQNQTINQTVQITSSDNSLDLSLEWSTGDLGLHLFSPTGEHIGFNESTNSTDLIENSTYDARDTKEEIVVQSPEPGNWTLGIYGEDVPSEGEPYSLTINRQGNYLPNVTAESISQTVVVNETFLLPLRISNTGQATAYNLSVFFTSDIYVNISQNMSYNELGVDESISTYTVVLPKDLGNGTIWMNVTYYDKNGSLYNFLTYTDIGVITTPKLVIFQTYSPWLNTNTKDTLTFSVTITNVGSSTAYGINTTFNMQNVTPITQCNFTKNELSVGESMGCAFNATASEGRWYTTVYATYENSNSSTFIAGSNELEIKVDEATTYMDIDGDYIDEYANDLNNDTIYDMYVDPNNNSIAIEIRDFNSDNRPDFLIDTNNDNAAEIFYDPNNGFYTGIVSINLSDNLIDRLLLAVDKDTTLDFYYDVSNNITTKLKQFNMTSYYIDVDGDGLYDVLYDLLTGKSCSKGDLNCDAMVNHTDHLMFEQVYESTCSNISYNHLADFNDDCNITFVDFVRFARRYKE